MTNILGYTFEEILSAQQGGRLRRVVDTSQPLLDPVQERADVQLLVGYGEKKLREMGHMGVIDRLERGGYIAPLTDELEKAE
jgi:hypothetical protein